MLVTGFLLINWILFFGRTEKVYIFTCTKDGNELSNTHSLST